MGLTCPSPPAAYARTGKIKHFCGISYPIGKFLREAQYATRRSGGKAECNGALETPESYNDSACPFRGCREATGIRKNHPHTKRGRLKRVGLFFFMSGAPQRQQLASERTPLTSFAPAPSTVSCVPLTRNLSTADPSPPVAGGSHASQRQQHAALLRIRSTAMYFLRLCARATSPNSTLTLVLDFSLKRLKP